MSILGSRRFQTHRTVRSRPVAGPLIALLLLGSGAAAAAAGAAGQAPPGPQPGPRTFALLLNGDDGAKHLHNVELALGVLARRGIPADRLLVLSGSPATPQPGPPARYLRPTWASLRTATRDLAKAMRGGDTLVVYTTGHGVWEGGVPVLLLHDDTVSARELARRLLAIPFGRLVFVADQCYSGAFAREFRRARRNIVAISSTDSAHEVLCTFFSRPFWRALDRGAGSAADSVSEDRLRAAFATAVEAQRVADPAEPSRAQFVATSVVVGR